ncbi:MAG: sulfate ABC transporter substrate-binding protein [Planctomycetaceae bacterium]|nr:sulfate ABC transporter substrate-binding protein [Planctomycetaceae bacterium]
MKWQFTLLVLACCVISIASCCGCSKYDREIQNVSYDPTRELYKDINESFEKYWLREKGEKIRVNQSHGGSGAQSNSVIEGNAADVVTLALGYDIDAIVEHGKDLIPNDWQSKLPHNSCPYTSTIVFLVRKGNPKEIYDWEDLLKDNVTIVTPNPQTSGGARWNYLAAWGYMLKKELGGLEALSDPARADEVAIAHQKAAEFVQKMFSEAKAPAKDTGARGSTNRFVRNGMGDVLLAWENEALLCLAGKEKEDFEIVTPSISILAEPPVALVEKNVKKQGTQDLAEAYLKFLYEPEAQEIIAKNYYRPTDGTVAAKYANQFPNLELFEIDKVFGGWSKAQKEHFSSGGTYDQLIIKAGR